MAPRSLICVPLFVESIENALLDAESARASGADLVEFRVDALVESHSDPSAAVGRLTRDSCVPCVLTCRPHFEGGGYSGPESARLDVLLGAMRSDHPPAFVDIELAAMDRSPSMVRELRSAKASSPSRVIVSTHDFAGRPPDLARRLLRMAESEVADVRKIAISARSIRDNLELFDLCVGAPIPTIALAMGRFGLLSRVLSPKFGGFLTFAALRAGAGTAPGQPTIHDLISTYRFRDVGPSTRVYGIIGDPVEHSMSPAVHNAAFEASGYDGVYLPLPVPTGPHPDDAFLSLKATLPSLILHPALSVGGLSVTIPHKEAVVRLARDMGWTLDPDVERIGAANTLSIDAPGADPAPRVRVSNTDAGAALRCLNEMGAELSRAQAVVIGAGGVARAITTALLDQGAHVRVINRTPARARALVQALHPLHGDRVSMASLDSSATPPPDIVVNCTPAGMPRTEQQSESPLPAAWLSKLPKGTVVLDTVYSRDGTPLVRQARALGLRAQDGVDMFVFQAAAQFETWARRPAPLPLLSRTARELCV